MNWNPITLPQRKPKRATAKLDKQSVLQKTFFFCFPGGGTSISGKKKNLSKLFLVPKIPEQEMDETNSFDVSKTFGLLEGSHLAREFPVHKDQA